jgi:hypothetical protein
LLGFFLSDPEEGQLNPLLFQGGGIEPLCVSSGLRRSPAEAHQFASGFGGGAQGVLTPVFLENVAERRFDGEIETRILPTAHLFKGKLGHE